MFARVRMAGLGISGVLLILISATLPASAVQYLKKNEAFCDSSGTVCLRGTISYRVNPRLLQLRARITKAPGPGQLKINVAGNNRLAHPRRAAIEVTIRGKASEIVNTDMIPDAPDVSQWELVSIQFAAD